MLALTESAAEAIEAILTAAPEGAGMRIEAAPPMNDNARPVGGDLNVTIVDEPAQDDQVIDEGGAHVFVEDTVAEYLDDKLLDAQVTEGRVTFMIGERTP